MLKELGFTDITSCVIEVCADERQIEKIQNMAIEFEADAFNTPDGQYPNDNNSDYIKYGWLFDFFIKLFKGQNLILQKLSKQKKSVG